MLAVTPEGLIGHGPSTGLEVAFDAAVAVKQRLLQVLATGADAAAVAEVVETERAEAARLLEQLERAGALAPTPPEPPPPRGASLIAALLRLEAQGELPDLVWTADEALVVPRGLDGSQQRRLLRAFIAGIEPRERRVAYGYAAHWRAATVWGDVPDPERLEAALSASPRPSTAIEVVSLDGADQVSLDPEDLPRLGVDGTHRLGPITSTSRVELTTGPARLYLVSARMATPNLAHPEPPVVGLSGKGTASSPERAPVAGLTREPNALTCQGDTGTLVNQQDAALTCQTNALTCQTDGTSHGSAASDEREQASGRQPALSPLTDR